MQAGAQAANTAGNVQTEDVATQLRTGSFDTVIGDIRFDSKGDVMGVENFIMYVWGDEQYVPVQ